MDLTRQIPALLVIGAALVAFRLFGNSEIFDTLVHRELKPQYDYVIVGGGTAGCVLAARLAEDSDRTVLVLEAGADPSNNLDVDVPIYADRLIGSDFDWQLESVPQKMCCKSHKEGKVRWASGRGLGGSSLINYMQYLRGSRHDYDEWAGHGAHGWAYKDVLPYFIKSEDNRNGEYVRTVFHGFGGRMSVADTYLSTVHKIIDSAFKELNITKRDINGKTNFGYGHTQATMRWGSRLHTYKAFLKRIIHLDNIKVVTGATVNKILFEGKKAVGVTFTHKDKPQTVKATREIILSAGAYNTPKLLMLSGIGPRQHLQDLKIPLVADLPVGDNLHDHVMADGIEFFSPHAVSVTPTKAENFLSSWEYSIFGTGLKASPRFREGVAYLRTRHQPPHIRYPLIGFEIVANVGTFSPDHINLNEDTWFTLHGKPPHREGFTMFPMLLHPRSRGTVRLSSKNIDDPLKINPNYLAEDFDVKILVEAFQYIRKMLIGTQALTTWEFSINNQQIPECAKFGNFTNDYVECYLRHVTHPGRSPGGTCKLGALGDPTAVVDPLLRVRGIKGLRVVDGSVIPLPTSGNAYTATVMIAEKAADLIRDKDTVKPIREYFKHLITVKHQRFTDEDEAHPTIAATDKDEKPAAGQGHGQGHGAKKPAAQQQQKHKH